jgi:DNA-binding transcriptional regulator YiaG
MKIETRNFDVSIPTLDGKEVAELVTIQIPMEWDDEIGEWLMTEEGLEQVEETKVRHMGLLIPSEMRALRNRLELTQKQIGELLQIGEKTWTRWETGKGRPSRSVNLLLRALHDRELSVEYLQRAAEYRTTWRKVIPFQHSKSNKSVQMDKLLRCQRGQLDKSKQETA